MSSLRLARQKITHTCYGRHAADDSDDKQDVEGRHGGGTAAAAVWPHTLPCSRRAAASVTRPRDRTPGRASGGRGTANPSARSRPGPPRSFLLPSSGYDLGASASTAVVVGDMEIKRCTRYQSRTHIVNNGRADKCGRSIAAHIQSALSFDVNSALKLRYIPHGSIVL